MKASTQAGVRKNPATAPRLPGERLIPPPNQDLSAHVRALADGAPDLTADQIDQLRQLAVEPGTRS